MKVTGKIDITRRHLIDELPGAWTLQDYKKILDETGLADGVADAEVIEMTRMALSDQEPEESADMVLRYRMNDALTDGQIKQLSHEMQEDKISEEYPDMALQHELYNVNQFLFKAYNGKFPNCKAIEVDLTLTLEQGAKPTDEIIIRAIAPALGDHSVIARLYEDELKGEQPFTDASSILWKKEIKDEGNGVFQIKAFSSEYWFHDLPMNIDEYALDLKMFEGEEAET